MRDFMVTSQRSTRDVERHAIGSGWRSTALDPESQFGFSSGDKYSAVLWSTEVLDARFSAVCVL